MMELHLRTYGEAGRPPLVLLHGLFGSAANWGTVARRLADRFHVLVPDLRNHGQSPQSSGHSYPAMADDVRALLQRHAKQPAVVIGHSMGGKVAMFLALAHPERVGRLVVVDMAPVAYTHDFADALQAFAAVDLATIGGRADADRQMAAAMPASGIRAFLLQNLVKQGDGWAWRLNLEALSAAQRDITGFVTPRPGSRFDGPSAFIHGGLSSYVLPSHVAGIRRLFPRAVIRPIEGAGHWVYADRPDAFMAALDSFLDADD